MRVLIAAGLLVLWLLVPAAAGELAVGERVVLQPTNPLGVPLHRELRASMFGRGEDGLGGRVVDLAQEGRWARVALDDGREAWIVATYLEPGEAVAPPPDSDTAAPDPQVVAAVFGSRAGCEQAVAAGDRLPGAAARLRLVTWNIRWFPVGDPRGTGQETDLAWLACALAWIDPGVVAVEESLATREADFAWASVLDGVAAVLGGDWQLDLHECGGERQQHVGFLWDAERVSLTDARDLWQLNGAAADPGSPCANNLRPGRGAYVRSLAGGADFHIVGVHADSGTKARDFDHRTGALERLDEVFTELMAHVGDADVIVLGDFNTMGANGRMDASSEIALLAETVGAEAPGFRHLAPDLQCTEYFQGACGWLDHVIVTRSMAEAADAAARVTGYCAVTGGEPRDELPGAYDRLSDHCPVVVDIADRDLD